MKICHPSTVGYFSHYYTARIESATYICIIYYTIFVALGMRAILIKKITRDCELSINQSKSPNVGAFII